ncbi:TRAP transporter substrate-binding protein [Bacillus sp. B15-48]|uniref:TRAP transporter substrate-binding protein n=1 Tax=Bacillus sp. B15-48 TaxID=1548601 RepID=UPI00193ED1B3|nr:TRAP transporter substrate-binding protein [Bacillus sp. B15-48]
MNGKKLYLTVLLMISLLVLAACGGNASETASENNNDPDKVYKLRLPTVVSEDNYVATTFLKFKELAEEKSDGRLQVEIYLNGTLSSSDEEHFQLQREGTAELNGMSTFIPAQTAGVNGYYIFDVPFLFENRDQLYSYIESPIMQDLTKEFENETGVRILGYYDLGLLSIMNSNHKVEEPNDLNGLSIRTPGSAFFMDTIEVMGGNPTPITFAEVYTSLQQGVIDGLTTTLPLMYNGQFHEVSKNITLTNHVINLYMLTINNTFFEKLPEDLQQVVLEAADETIEFARNLTLEQEELSIEKLEEAGVEIHELTPEQFEMFRDSVQPAIEKNIDSVGEDLYNRTLDFLNQ